jgi:hypothetical protein
MEREIFGRKVNEESKRNADEVRGSQHSGYKI